MSFPHFNLPIWKAASVSPGLGLKILLFANSDTTGDTMSEEDWIDQDTTDGQSNDTVLDWNYSPGGGNSKVVYDAPGAYWEGTMSDWQDFYSNNYDNLIPIDGSGVTGVHVAGLYALVSAPTTGGVRKNSLIDVMVGNNYGGSLFLVVSGTSRTFEWNIADTAFGTLVLSWGPISPGVSYQVSLVADNDSGAARFRMAINNVVMDTEVGSELLESLDAITELGNPIPRAAEGDSGPAVVRFYGFAYTSDLP